MAAAALLAGCSSSSTTFGEAEALEVQGKHEEAAAKFDLVCALDPRTEKCPSSLERATAASVHAAEQAANEGAFRKAERIYRLALLSADDASAASVKLRLAAGELKQGVRYEKAAADPDKLRAFETMEAIALEQGPAVEKAKAWIAAARPGVLVARIKKTCRPKPKGSCSKLWSEIEALAQKPDGAEEARAAYDAEQKRIAKPLLIATRFLDVFKSRHVKKQDFDKCVTDTASARPGAPASEQCVSDVYGQLAYERYDSEHQEDETFRRALATIADPELVAALEARKKAALESGSYEKLEVKKAAGGGK